MHASTAKTKVLLLLAVRWILFCHDDHGVTAFPAFLSRFIAARHNQTASRKQHAITAIKSTVNDKEQDTLPSQTSAPSLDGIRELTETAIFRRNSHPEQSLDALTQLGQLCTQRNSYSFDTTTTPNSVAPSSIVAHQPQMMSESIIDAFRQELQMLEQKGWLSTNADSVDGLPSLHMNLVSNGIPFHQVLKDKAGHADDELSESIEKLLQLVHPYIYNDLLPTIHRLLNDTSIQVSDVFLRRYGDNVGSTSSDGSQNTDNAAVENDDDPNGDTRTTTGWQRTKISAHYDVYSHVTSVIAMDDTASNGRNGLYTTATTSNHVALREFFRLNKGDAIIHTWDVLHGVDIQPNVDRTSLIIWFTSDGSKCQSENENTLAATAKLQELDCVSPWLSNRNDLESNSIAQFVLASALPSTERHDDHTMNGDTTNNSSDSERLQHELYLKSAIQMNTFALTRMGSLCEEEVLSITLMQQASEALDAMRPVTDLPFMLNGSSMDLARRFWLEAAVRGNPLAQQALADDLMFEASQSGDADLRHLAAILFALAAQQGMENSQNSLFRVVEFDVAAMNEAATMDEAMESPVFRVYKSVTSSTMA